MRTGNFQIFSHDHIKSFQAYHTQHKIATVLADLLVVACTCTKREKLYVSTKRYWQSPLQASKSKKYSPINSNGAEGDIHCIGTK